MSGFKKLSAYVDVPCEWVSIAAPHNGKLEAENAKLRELVEDMLDCIEIRSAFHRPPTTEITHAERTYYYLALKDAMTENAKLRELLQRTWDAFHDATAREFVTVKNELRELGIEVDDGQQCDV